jgi:hypothetical protein
MWEEPLLFYLGLGYFLDVAFFLIILKYFTVGFQDARIFLPEGFLLTLE